MARPTYREALKTKEQALALENAKKDGDVQYLLDGLKDPVYRSYAALALGDLRVEAAVQPLIRLLRARESGPRSAAAEALGRIGSREAVPQLLESVRAEKEVVPRTRAIMALGKIGDESAVVPLCDLLKADDVLVRQAAANALGLLGHPDAIEPLQRARAKERWFDRGRHRQALRKIRGRRL